MIVGELMAKLIAHDPNDRIAFVYDTNSTVGIDLSDPTVVKFVKESDCVSIKFDGPELRNAQGAIMVGLMGGLVLGAITSFFVITVVRALAR